MKPIKDHYDNLNKEYIQRGKKVRKQKSSTNIGTSVEGILNDFIRNNMPQMYKVSSGEIFDSLGKQTNQVDTIVYRNNYPILDFGENIRHYFSEGVALAAQTTTNLDQRSLPRLYRQSTEISELIKKPKHLISAGGVSRSIPTVLFALEGLSLNKIYNLLRKETENQFDRFPNIVCVLDQGILYRKNDETDNKVVVADGILPLYLFFLLTAQILSRPEITSLNIDEYIRNDENVFGTDLKIYNYKKPPKS